MNQLAGGTLGDIPADFDGILRRLERIPDVITAFFDLPLTARGTWPQKTALLRAACSSGENLSITLLLLRIIAFSDSQRGRAATKQGL